MRAIALAATSFVIAVSKFVISTTVRAPM